MGLIFSFGNLDYPITVGTRFVYDNTVTMEMGRKAMKMVEGSTIIIPMWKYLIQMFLLQALFIIASVSFAFLLSTVVKSSMVSMATSVVVIIVFTIFQSMPYVRDYAHFLFTTFGDPSNILSGNMAMNFNNPSVTTTFAIGVMVIWSVVSYVIAHVVFTKKDILI
jgi:ABC-2 type transport system permease protein